MSQEPSSSQARKVFDLADEGVRPEIRLLNMILSEGIASNATQIRIEVAPTACLVLVLMNGAWVEVMKVPRAVGTTLIGRIRVMTDMDRVGGKDVQEGGTSVRLGDAKIDLKVTIRQAKDGAEEALIGVASAAA